jgi:hypothetical protein
MVISKVQERTWRYVGRFMNSFAVVEAGVDNIFEIMFNLNSTAMLLIQGNLDFRKKLNLLRLGFERQNLNPGPIFGKLQSMPTLDMRLRTARLTLSQRLA